MKILQKYLEKKGFEQPFIRDNQLLTGDEPEMIDSEAVAGNIRALAFVRDLNAGV